MDTLLFIPDISGFTRFVNETEVEHSRHIITELLELIIGADTMGLTVAEVEGDAVFFYSESTSPSPSQIIAQAKGTFVAFHEHLKKYESRRICGCGACVTAHRLTLKFVVHKGPIGFVEINGSRKPHGPDVILVHRLLKNEVQSDEYLLATQTVLANESPTPHWGGWVSGCTSYESVGSVEYCHTLLTPLLSEVKEPPLLREYRLIPKPVVGETTLPASAAEVFEMASNISLRHLWTDPTVEIIYEEDRVNRAGTRHQCIVRGQPIDFETVRAAFGEGFLVVGERVDANPLVESFAIFWIISRNGDGAKVRAELHYHPKSPLGGPKAFLFRLIAKRLVAKGIRSLTSAMEKRSGSVGAQTQPVLSV